MWMKYSSSTTRERLKLNSTGDRRKTFSCTSRARARRSSPPSRLRHHSIVSAAADCCSQSAAIVMRNPSGRGPRTTCEYHVLVLASLRRETRRTIRIGNSRNHHHDSYQQATEVQTNRLEALPSLASPPNCPPLTTDVAIAA